jgi:retron-type reverse transcriptase
VADLEAKLREFQEYFNKHRTLTLKLEITFCVRGVISPLLANIYLHYVLDQWVIQWRKKFANGDVIAVRYAHDFVLGFQRRIEAVRLLEQLRERLRAYGLELHSEKTRLIQFGRYAAEHRERDGQGKPERSSRQG